MSELILPCHDEPREEYVAARVPCTCKRVGSCRCHCSRCGSRNLKWKAWGSYLDKDLVCQNCGHTQSIWDC